MQQKSFCLAAGTVALTVYSLLLVYTFDARSRVSTSIREPVELITAIDNVTYKMWPRYVVAKSVGRLGNQMYVYASLLGIAAMNNMTPVFYARDNSLTGAFKSLVAVDNARAVRLRPNTEVTVHEISNCMYDRRFEVLHTLSVDKIVIEQYLQSWRYFSNVEPAIRRQLAFRDSHAETASRFLRTSAIEAGFANKENVLFIAVHIRRTDWLQAIGDVCGIQYLRKSVKYMIDRFRDHCLLFVVCSDDMIWTQSNFPALLSNVSDSDSKCKPQVTFSVNRTAAQDMAIMTGCNHTVITIGSYGWWAAYLAGGVTVYCNRYPPASKTPLMVRQDDMYLPTWKGLS